MVFSEVFWTGLYTAGVGVILAIMNQCYKSKCNSIDLCCIKIIRNVEIEEHIDRTIVRSPTFSKRGLPSEI